MLCHAPKMTAPFSAGVVKSTGEPGGQVAGGRRQERRLGTAPPASCPLVDAATAVEPTSYIRSPLDPTVSLDRSQCTSAASKRRSCVEVLLRHALEMRVYAVFDPLRQTCDLFSHVINACNEERYKGQLEDVKGQLDGEIDGRMYGNSA